MSSSAIVLFLSYINEVIQKSDTILEKIVARNCSYSVFSYQNQNQNNFISEIYNVSNIKINLLLMGANFWKQYKWTLPLSHRSPIVV